jgi:hypothetical protein
MPPVRRASVRRHAKRLEEPRPPEEYCQAHPGERAWREHVALFLHVPAEKPA